MQLTFAPARSRKYFVKKFNLIGKYIHGSGPHYKYWTKSLTTSDFLSKLKTKSFFTLLPYFKGLLLIFLTSEMQLTFAPVNFRPFQNKNLPNLIGANVKYISNLKKFNSNPMKQVYNVNKALVFAFERKSKVGNEIVQNFPCGPLPSIYFPIKFKIFYEKNLLN